MKNRYFYMSDIEHTITVEYATRKELLEMITEMCENLMSEAADMYDYSEDVYMILYKDGTEDFINDEYDGHHIEKQNIASIVNSNACTYIVYGHFVMDECGNAYPAFEDKIDDTNIKEVDREDYVENEIAQNDAQDVVETVNDKVIDETENVTQNEPETNEEQPENNGWELIAKQQLDNAYNWLVGERENSVNDGETTDKEFNEWIVNEALEEIYHEAITTKYHEDACGGKAPKEMRFAGKNFCYNYLTKLFKEDGYNVDKPTEKKQRGKYLIEYDGRVQNLSQWAKELGMPGQTLFARIHVSGWTVEKAFTTPVKKRKKEGN